MKPLWKDYFWQAGETVSVLLNTPTYLPFYVHPAGTGALWLKMTEINPWLPQAEKECTERILDISKNPINSQTIQLLKGKDQSS